MQNDLLWDLSVRSGENEIQYTLINTWNPSLGPESPTEFRPGDLVTDEWSLNADFSYALDTRLVGALNIAFGFEYREEGYELREGRPGVLRTRPVRLSGPVQLRSDPGRGGCRPG